MPLQLFELLGGAPVSWEVEQPILVSDENPSNGGWPYQSRRGSMERTARYIVRGQSSSQTSPTSIHHSVSCCTTPQNPHLAMTAVRTYREQVTCNRRPTAIIKHGMCPANHVPACLHLPRTHSRYSLSTPHFALFASCAWYAILRDWRGRRGDLHKFCIQVVCISTLQDVLA